MNYDDWAATVPAEITGDLLWKAEAYRLALFVGDLCWYDATRLIRDRRTPGLSDQLYRSVGSISANIAEGYSRGTGKDRARFYEYAPGSARESRDWYHKARHMPGYEVTLHCLRLLVQIIRLLLTMISRQPGHVLRDTGPTYLQPDETGAFADPAELTRLLHNVPLPT